MKDLPRRVVTAVVFVAIMLCGIMLNEYGFLVLMLIINTGCIWEYGGLIRSAQEYSERQARISRIYNMVAGTIIFYLLATGFRFLAFVNDYIFFIIAPLLLGYLILELFLQSSSPLRNAALNAMGIIYVSLPLSMAVFFPYVHENAAWFPERCGLVLGIVLLVWTNDTMAYFTGSLLGKHKMLPAVSPKKTWEGFAGGVVFAMVAGWVLSLFFHQLNGWQWVVTAAIISIFGTTGDFVESMMKRNAGVKDSGTMLPGHGGFLDRFDAFIFCIPFVFVFYMVVILTG
jgi:phosphatidate cytidylyltransferase